MDNVLTLGSEDLVNSNALQINVTEDGVASAVGMPVNVVPAEGSYVLKQLDDGTTVLLDAMTFLNMSMGQGQLVLNSAPVGTDLLSHSIFSSGADADPSGSQLLQGLEPGPEEVPPAVAAPAEEQVTSVEVLLAKAPTLTGHQPAGRAARGVRRHLPRLYPPEPEPEPPGPAPWPCPQCGRKFTIWKRYLSHVRSHDYEKPYKCSECLEAFNYQKNLELHLVTHSSELQCPDCLRVFRRAASLRAHLAVHQLEEALSCPRCQQDFPTQALLDKHLPVHSSEPAEESPAAPPRPPGRPLGLVAASPEPERAVDTTELLVVRQPPAPGAHQCSECRMVFTSAADLREHEQAHQAVQSLRSVNRRRVISKPGRQPRGSRRCQVCHKTFAKPNLLARHMLIHTGERPFQCDQCDRAFNQKSSLKNHIESLHGKLRPYRCQVCKLTFTQKGNLRNHVRRIHNLKEASQRPYKCSQCGCGFGSSSTLSSHISKMHERPPDTHIGPDALRDLVKQLLEYSEANETTRERIHSHIADIVGTVRDDELPRVLGGLWESLEGLTVPHVGRVAGTGAVECAETAVATEAGERGTEGGGGEMEGGDKAESDNRAKGRDRAEGGDRAKDGDGAEGGDRAEGVDRAESGDRVESSNGVERGAEPVSAVQQAELQPAVPSVPELQPAEQLQPAADVELPSDKLPCPALPTISEPNSATDSPAHPALTSLNTATSSSAASVIARLANSISGSGTSARRRPAMVTLVDKVGCAGESRHSWANSDANPGGDGRQQGRKYLVPVRYEARIRWFQCVFCTKEFRKPYDLVRHLRIHTKDKPFKCVQCSRTFTVRSGLEAHMRVHRGIKLASCHICHKKFSNVSAFRVHLRVHTGAKPFSCPICHKTFRTLGNRNVHVASHHSGEPDDQGNDLRPGRRKEPESTHVDVQLEPPIQITQDGSMIQEERGRRVPPASDDSEDRPHRCTVCKAAFKKVSHMRQHMKQHTGERPFRCSFCPKGFITSSALTSHERTHTGARFYKCPVCGSGFTTGSSLKRHMSTHSEDRPFMCPYCHRRFKTRMICKKHMRKHKAELARKLDPSQRGGAVPGGGEPVLFPGLMASEQQQLLSAGVPGSDCPARQPPEPVSLLLDQHGCVVQLGELAPGEVRTLTAAADGTLAVSELAPGGTTAQAELAPQLSSSLGQPLFPASELAGSLGEVIKPAVSAAADPHTQAVMVASIATIGRPDDEPLPVERVTVDPGTVPLDTGTVPLDTEALPLDPGTVTLDPEAVPLDPNTVQLDPGTVQLDPATVPPDPGTVPLNPGTVPLDPSTAALDPAMEAAAVDEETPAADEPADPDSDDDEALRLRNEQHGQMILEMDSDNVLLQDPSLSQPLIHRCGICKKMFTSRLALTTHEEVHSVRGDRRPEDPGSVRPSTSQPAPPRRTPGAYLCSQCLTVFATAEQLTAHRVTHEPAPPPSPPPQPLRTQTQPPAAERSRPARTPSPASPQPAAAPRQCPQCAASFASAAALKKHVAREHGRGRRKNKQVIRLSEKLTARLAEQPLNVGRSQAEVCLIQSALEKVKNRPVPRAEPEDATDAQLKHRCSECGKAFRKPSDLARHVRIHTGEKPFSCEICLKRFTIKSTLVGHLRTHSGQRDFHCLVCKASFGTKCALRVHSRLHTGARPYQCEVCGRWFRTSGHRNIHMTTHGWQRGRRPAQLPAQKEEGEVGSAQLQGALDELTAETTGVTEKTGQPQSQQPQSRSQQSQSDDEEAADDPAPVSPSRAAGDGSVLQLEPGLAGQLQLVLAAQTPAGALPADTELRVQLQIDPQGRIVGLEALQPSGDDSAAVEADPPPSAAEPEVRLVEPRPEPEPQPQLGPERLSGDQARTLRQAVTGALWEGGVNAGSSGFRCHVCHRPFRRQSQWRRHMWQHGVAMQPPKAAGRSRHPCADCAASFSTPSQLSRHRRTHTGEKPFPCEQCGRAFSQKNALVIHMAIHRDERPHTCPFCGHGFAQKGNMRIHIQRAHLKTAIEALEMEARTATEGGAV